MSSSPIYHGSVFMVQKPTQNVKENTEIFEYIYENHPPDDVDISLSTVSKRDSVWDTHRNDTATVGDIYALNAQFERYSERMGDCSGYLVWYRRKRFKAQRSQFLPCALLSSLPMAKITLLEGYDVPKI